MSPSKLLKSAAIPLAALCLAPLSVLAQGNPSGMYQVFFETVKPGMTAQFEQGVKQVDAWAGSHGDTTGSSMYEVLTGAHEGEFVVLSALSWATMDHPPSYAAGLSREANKVAGPYLASFQRTIVRVIPNVGNVPPAGSPPAKYYQIIDLTIKPNKMNDFVATLEAISAAEKKENPSPNPFIVYEQLYGGPSDRVTIAIGHSTWADFGRAGKPMAEVLRQAYDAAAATSLTETLDGSIASSETELAAYRSDLSYTPSGQGQ